MVGDMVEENGKFTLENCTYIAPEGYKFKAWAIGSVNGEQKQTEDNSMRGLWIALLFVSGFGVVTTTVIGKKKSSAK